MFKIKRFKSAVLLLMAGCLLIWLLIASFYAYIREIIRLTLEEYSRPWL
jgi:uncharacterized protein YabE (DUF348 family)